VAQPMVAHVSWLSLHRGLLLCLLLRCVPGHAQDILIDSKPERNRALHGDTVLVELIEPAAAAAAARKETLSLKLSQLDDEIDQLTVQLGRRLAERRAVSSSLVALLAAAAPTPPLPPPPPPPPPPPEEAMAKARHKAKKQRAKDGRRQKRRAVTAQELRSAVTENDVSRLEELLAEGASAEEQNERGNTVLHDAVYYGHDAAVGRLLAVGSPSFFAVGNDEDNTPLHSAAYGGRIGAARLLVDAARANGMVDRITARSVHGHSPLDVAVSRPHSDASSEHEEVVRLLHANGADVNARSGLDPVHGKPPLYMAAAKGDVQMCRTLLLLGADVNQLAAGGFTALHTAAGSGNVDLVVMLLEHGADPSAVGGEEEWTALHRAVGGNSNVDTVKALIEAVVARAPSDAAARHVIDAKLKKVARAVDESEASFEARAELSGATPLLVAAMAAPGCTHRACEALPRSTTRTDATQRELISLLVAAGADSSVSSAVSGLRAADFLP
jgi:ankyrin repeat protein